MNHLNGTNNRRSISIIWVFIITFILLLLITIIGISYMVFSNWEVSGKEFTAGLARKMTLGIEDRVNSFIQSSLNMNDVNSKLFEDGVINFSDDESRDKFLTNSLHSFSDYIYSYGFGTTAGEYFAARRNQSGKMELTKSNHETSNESWVYTVNEDMSAGAFLNSEEARDPRAAEWYQSAVQAKGPAFSAVYRCSFMKDLAISAAQPVYNDNGEVQVVLNARILLSDMNKTLTNIVDGYGGYVVIMENNSRYLIGNSLGADNYEFAADGALERKTADVLGNSAIKQAYKQYLLTGDSNQFVEGESGGLFASFCEYKLPGIDWIIVSAIPEETLTTELMQSIRTTALLVCIAGLLSVLVFFMISRKLLKPMFGLLSASEQFAAGDLNKRALIIRNDEIGRISEAFNQVADNMQALINNLEQTVASRTKELKQANDDLGEHRNQLQLILDAMAEGIFGTDLEGICTFCNASCLRLLGFEHTQDMLGKEIRSLIRHSYRDGTLRSKSERPLTEYLTAGMAGQPVEDVFWRAGGGCFDAEWRAMPRLKNGRRDGFVVTFTDITVRKQEEEKILFLSCHDAMTGLENRRCFEHEMEMMDTKENVPISVIYIDLNGLKMINDAFGHSAGDELIVNAAEVLKGNCRESDVAARVGGDEFAILLPRTALRDAEMIANRLKTEFSRKEVHMICGSMAIGVSTKTRSYQILEQTLKIAENEMYKEKNISGKRFGADAIKSIIRSLHQKSPREKRHSEEVSRLCEEIGTAMRLPEPEIRKLRDAGYLHDIGKIALSNDILEKDPETLTEGEKERVRQHPAVGYRILNLYEDSADLADGVFGHHERWDGSGYPKGLKGEEIPFISRIIAIAEAYERVRNRGNYLEESKECALRVILEGAGKQFDPSIPEHLRQALILDIS